MPEIKRINSRAELILLARELRVREDWHEPDEQKVTAEFHGQSFDNAGTWGTDVREEEGADWPALELYVTLWQEVDNVSRPVADINLALLFAWATGFEGGDETVSVLLRDETWDAARRLESLSGSLARQASRLRAISTKHDQ